jgi:Tol biopolymer transport system component
MRAALPLLVFSLASAASAETERHLADLRQLTFGGENAEAYWSPDGAELVFQSTRPPHACDQIFRIPAAGGQPELVSPGSGRATCSYFTHDGNRILYSSTHAQARECPPVPDRSQGYVWPVYAGYEIWSAKTDGTDLRQLTASPGYDAEATVCPKDGAIVFTSARDGDLELYRMNADGSAVKRLTTAPGYDGGAFFSPDCSRIVWRASRPAEGAELDDFRALLAAERVRPGKLELWTANADGSDARQITYLGAASFAPSFFPSGKRIVFSSNVGDPQGREFELWAVDVDGTDLERLTYSPGFDGFPMFSPDGRSLAFASNRNQAARGETNVFVARWVDEPAAKTEPGAADRYRADVDWLADDAREGRGPGTAGLAAAAAYLEARYREIGLQPAGENGTFLQRFRIPMSLAVEEGTRLVLGEAPVAAADFRPAPFSASGAVAAAVVPAGYGIVAPELGRDDYDGLDVRGKIALVRRFVPAGAPFDTEDAERRYGDLRHKAWAAREKGAAALLIADVPVLAEGAVLPEEAEFPSLRAESRGDAGLPVVFVRRAVAAPLFAGEAARADLAVRLRLEDVEGLNVVGKLPARAGGASGAVLIGAHYDHLGWGGSSSLSPGERAVHNGADDNASGTAALLAAARRLAARAERPRRDVYFVAFSGEESGVLGSTAYTRRPPDGLALDSLVAMINMDMVGRLRDNQVSVLGAASASEWGAVVPPLCDALGLRCALGGDGFGPSDQTPFYAAGIPVLHLFTGVHSDYHRTSDDAELINAAGGARVAALAADLAAAVAERDAKLTYQAHATPLPQGDTRARGGSLGTVPDYAGPPEGRPGVLLAGVRAGGPADRAGLRRGDVLVELGGKAIRDVNDLMYALGAGKPGEMVVAVVERDGKRVELAVTFGPPTRMR